MTRAYNLFISCNTVQCVASCDANSFSFWFCCMALPWCGLLHQRVSIFLLGLVNQLLIQTSNIRGCVSWVLNSVVLSGVQHVPGNAGGLHRAAQGGFAGLALCSPHTAVKEDGRWSAGLSAGQSAESSRCHQVCPLLETFGIYFLHVLFLSMLLSVSCVHVSSLYTLQRFLSLRSAVQHLNALHCRSDTNSKPQGWWTFFFTTVVLETLWIL